MSLTNSLQSVHTKASLSERHKQQVLWVKRKSQSKQRDVDALCISQVSLEKQNRYSESKYIKFI